VRKQSVVALVVDCKKDSPKGIAQPQEKGAPVMTAVSDGTAVLNSFLTEFLNETALQNGAVAISEWGVCGFWLGFHVMETENIHVFEEEFLDVMKEENLHVLEEEYLDVEEEILDVMSAENLHVVEEESFDVEEEILDVMEAENLHVIEEERSVPVSTPRKPKRVKLMTPKLIRSGKMTDRSDNHKVTKHMARKKVRSDGMVLNFDEIVSEEGADVEKGDGKRKVQYYVFRHRLLGHKGLRLRFRADDDWWVTVMKGAKRDAEREITMPVYSATYSGKGINHRTNTRSMTRLCNDSAQDDRDLFCKIDRRAAKRPLELANCKMKNEKKRKTGTKRAKETFDLLTRQDTSVQAEDKRREIAVLRRKQINFGKSQFISGRCRFVVDMGEKMSGDALNEGFQFARSKVPNQKDWRNTYDQVQTDWGTHKSLSMKWARMLMHRVRHRQLEVEKRRSQKSTKRVFMCSKRAEASDDVYGKGMSSL
jgi:hypothetical protein